MEFINDPVATYDKWITSIDSRVAAWPLMSNPLPTILICITYCSTAYLLPLKLDGKVFQITWVIRAYNMCMVILNFHIAKELLSNSVGYFKNWQCEPLVFSEDERSMAIARAIWWFYISKAVEMLDTIFFALRGKYSHLSFLHIYHHCSMFLLWWIGCAYMAGGAAVPCIVINSSIHVVMYWYYFLAALGPEFKKYLGWKRHLTKLQIAQFFFNVCYNLNALFRVGEACLFPLWMMKLSSWYNASFIILFGRFYLKSYSSQEAKKLKNA